MQVRSFRSRAAAFVAIVLILSAFVFPAAAGAHNVSKRDASFVQSNQGAAIPAFVYLGAKHMVTGYDHIAFLVGVIFFLYRLKDIVQYVSLFTLGHSITLLAWRPRRSSCEPLRHRRDHWVLGGLQSFRQHGWFPAVPGI